MNATQTTRNGTNTDHSQSASTDTDSIDADVVQNLSPGDIITATHLTRRQHQKYLHNPDNTLKDVYCEETDYLVLNTPDPDDTRNVFAAKIIRLDDYSDYPTADAVPSPYNNDDDQDDDDEEMPGIWNITTPYTPYNNKGTGVTISHLGNAGSLVTHILLNITITDNQ